MQCCQNLLLFPSIYTPFFYIVTLLESTSLSHNIPSFTHIYAILQESTPSSHNIPPFLQLYATLPESTPPSQNMASFSITICDPLRIFPSLLGYTRLVYNYFLRSKSLPLPPRIYSLFYYYMRHSQNLPLSPKMFPPFLHLYASLPESSPPCQDIPRCHSPPR